MILFKEKLSFFDDLEVRFKALNGKEIITKLDANHNIDLILMDIEMPEMNGIEATQSIKQKYPQIKIIMLTVFDNDENIFNAIKAGADGYLLKEMGFKVSKDSYLYICNAINQNKGFNGKMIFEEVLIHYQIDTSYLEDQIQNMINVLNSIKPPPSNNSCENCAYSKKRSELNL